MQSLPKVTRYRKVGNRIEGRTFTEQPSSEWVDTPAKLTDQITPNTVWLTDADGFYTTITDEPDLSETIKAEIEAIQHDIEKEESFVKRKPGRPKKEV